MRLSKDLVGKDVVTIDDGRIVGHVRDIYLTPGLDAMAGVFLKKEGIIRRKSILVPADAVVVFGIDVVLITSADAVTDDKTFTAAANWVRLDKLQGREVDTPGGTRIGTVGDVVLDEEGGVTAYALSRVLVEGPIGQTRAIYREAVINAGKNDDVMTIDIKRAEDPNYVPPAPEPAASQPTEKRPQDLNDGSTSAETTTPTSTPEE
ncbi:MAG: PRC-barrel domain-containing protein [Candidatus Promineifilaceae bacterium]